MTLSIARVAPATAADWDDAWSRCEHATWFHSRHWAECWRAGARDAVAPRPLLVIFSDGRSALLPLSVQSAYLGLFRMHLSSPGGTYGGWISADALGAGHARLLAEHLLTRLGAMQWRISPFDPAASELGLPAAAVADETHVLDLAPGFDAIHRGWTKGHASAARKAAREGVTVRAADTLDDWRAYYRVYEDSLARWGDSASSRHRWELFQELAGRAKEGARLWLASHEGEVVAGAVCLEARRHVAYWHGAALASRFELRAVNLLLHDAIRDACERGFRWFDFNPSGGHEGVAAFKRSFGAGCRPAPVVTIESARHRLVRRLASLRRRGRA